MRKLILIVSMWIPAVALAQPAPTQNAAELRATCAAAMNADPSFEEQIIKVANEKTYETHRHAADDVARNERHVIFAYAAMWVVAAGFVIFLWRRQQALNREIASLKRELADALEEAK